LLHIAGCEEEGTISKSMEHSPYCEADSRSVGKEINCVLCRPNVITLAHILRQIYPLQNSYLVSLSISVILYSLPSYRLCAGSVVRFSVPKNVQNHTGSYPTTYLMGTGCYFPWRKAAVPEGEKLYSSNDVIKNV
jgi:hypothetical protein